MQILHHVFIKSRKNFFFSLSFFNKNGQHIARRLKCYYVTTPIYYANSVPHIGHLYTTVLADAANRWQQLKLVDSPFSNARLATGTDEHGLKVWQAAVTQKKDAKVYCDEVSNRFFKMCKEFEIEPFKFIRTTEPEHTNAVQHFWKTIKKNGYIYEGVYKGWYSTSDEAFVPSSSVEVSKDKLTHQLKRTCKETGNTLEWMEETNYMFKLSDFTTQIRDWIIDDENRIYPQKFRKKILSDLENPLQDLSVSREQGRISWGISVPGDPSQTIYVWLDALINYLTVAGYPDISSSNFVDMWPANVHLVGQDILRFHAIYWPAFLMAAGLQLPERIVVHSHWLYNNKKMSKSIGNVIDPFEVASRVSADAMRYYLLRQGVLHSDCNYSELHLYKILNSDLAHDLGNCLNRVSAKKLNPKGIYPCLHKTTFSYDLNQPYVAGKEEYDFMEQVKNLPYVVNTHMENFHFYLAIAQIINTTQKANLIIHRHKLWELDCSDQRQLAFSESMLHLAFEGLRVCGILLQPIIPNLAMKVLNRLSIPNCSRSWKDATKSFVELDGKKEPFTNVILENNRSLLFKSLKMP